jgi:dihydrofolate reductase
MISIIAAVDINNAIGKANAMPWHLPADFAYFKKTTEGYPIVMGSKTHESIGRVLPGRINVVLTEKESIPGVEVAHSLEEAFEIAHKENENVFVIGGASVYAQSLPFADRLHLTYVDTEVEGADAYFPEIDEKEWREVSRTKHPADEKNFCDMEFVVYERI